MQATRCQCKAVTVEIDGESFSMSRSEFKKRFPGMRTKGHYSSCNYCVNHWGLDLCGCGSGEKFGKCKNNLPECKRPAQSIEMQVTSCYCRNGWGTTGMNHRSPF